MVHRMAKTTGSLKTHGELHGEKMVISESLTMEPQTQVFAACTQ